MSLLAKINSLSIQTKAILILFLVAVIVVAITVPVILSQKKKSSIQSGTVKVQHQDWINLLLQLLMMVSSTNDQLTANQTELINKAIAKLSLNQELTQDEVQAINQILISKGLDSLQ